MDAKVQDTKSMILQMFLMQTTVTTVSSCGSEVKSQIKAAPGWSRSALLPPGPVHPIPLL